MNRARDTHSSRLFLTGSTGYIGGRLAPCLLERGYSIRCLTRDEEKLRARPWVKDPNVEVASASIDDHDSLVRALKGCDVAYYLIHSMISAGGSYRDQDRQLALAFAHAAEEAGVKRIIYLGGLGDEDGGLSEHLKSRREVEEALASTPVSVTVLRAAMIIGSGSASFEILRFLVERLPVMITPRWVRTECQPIAISNVLEYLVGALETPETIGRTLDIGGRDVMTYHDIMREMERSLGLPRRMIIPVPVLTPRLSSLWIHLITPISHRIARPLAEGLRNRVVCRNDEARRLMPQGLLSVREAIDAAVDQTRLHSIETAWSDAGVVPGDPDWAGGTMFEDRREIEIDAPRHAVFRALCRVGGGRGYYAADFLWKIRGAMDRLIGGPGLRRGRRDPEMIRYGDALDFWRVIAVDTDRRLLLRAEMKLPGVATLEFEITECGRSRCTLMQTARFKPRGLLGLAYWYAVLPLHGFVFKGMLCGIAREARALSRTSDQFAPDSPSLQHSA